MNNVFSEEYKFGLVLKTPCGLFCKYENVLEGTSYMGIEWCVEEDHAICFCPYTTLNSRCSQNNAILEDFWEHTNKGSQHWCELKLTNEPYVYENSVEKLLKEHYVRKSEGLNRIKEQRNGRLCTNQLEYSDQEEKWYDKFEPIHCINQNCRFCSLRNTENRKSHSYIAYDIEYEVRTKGFGLIPDGVQKCIIRNIKFHKHPISEDIASFLIKTPALTREINRTIERKLWGIEYEGNLISYKITNLRIIKRFTDNPDDEKLRSDGWHIAYADRCGVKKKKQKKNSSSKNRNVPEFVCEQLSLFL